MKGEQRRTFIKCLPCSIDLVIRWSMVFRTRREAEKHLGIVGHEVLSRA